MFRVQRTIQELFEVCSPTDDAGFPVKAEEFVVLSQEPSATEIIAPKIARPFIEVRTDVSPGGHRGFAAPAVGPECPVRCIGPHRSALPHPSCLLSFSYGHFRLEKRVKSSGESGGLRHLLPSSAAIRVLVGSSQATLPPLSRSWQLAVWSALPVLSDLLCLPCPARPHGLLFQLLSGRSPVCECVAHTRF